MAPSSTPRRYLGLSLVLVLIVVAGGQAAGYVDLAPDRPAEPATDAPTSTPTATSPPTQTTTATTTPAPTPTQTTTSGESGVDAGELERLVHQAVNDRRTDRGLSPLTHQPGLREIARYHSRDMSREGYFAHTAPDGETMGDRYDRFGYDCRVDRGDGYYATGAENIYKTQFGGTGYSEAALADRVVDGWMNSDGHRENILQDYWQNEGIGVAVVEEDGMTTVYVTQNFC
ncbi:CAP domain-containing protein [Haloarchaeobius sp. HME9146]|uniref:CAP domain-containing protein n=1 Tax=Haloarchaeobius sp. HME9146 TaxID=2978732 RepID=UPI0021BFDA03|nr:CAP domain-containing protein [Haloarchaeobius sp. HME9146]MCT9096663.1 CAP domain-containing protein [Haloarchaeobius sp. HME9146]